MKINFVLSSKYLRIELLRVGSASFVAFMRIALAWICVGLVFAAVSAQTGTRKKPGPLPQKSSPTKKTTVTKQNVSRTAPKPKTVPSPRPTPVDEKTEFEKASAIEDATERVEALKSFAAGFPGSSFTGQLKELLSASAYAAAEEQMVASETAKALDLFRLAAESAPVPVPAKLYSESLGKIPQVLYWQGFRREALEIARILETKITGNASQLAGLAMFYIGIEAGDDAVGLAELAVKSDPTLTRAYETLGLAQRVNFRLDESASAYQKALELDPESLAIKRALADLRRATGKSEEAVALYREVLSAEPADIPSRNGLVLSLFEAGKTDEAEKEFAAALENNPKNVTLVGNLAYWYAANKNGEKAIDLARRAIAIEPRYIWSHIALARGLMLQDRPLEAEEVLLKARPYGSFPTLQYELAAARFRAGFYREAAETLQNTFTVLPDGSVSVKVGGRVERKGSNIIELLADERRASIFASAAADDPSTSNKLRQLLVLTRSLASEKPDETATAAVAEEFVSGDDAFRFHRQLYAASLLLDKKVASTTALKFAEAILGNTDTALAVPNAGALVMASELYESRQKAFSRNELLKVPDVPRQTLSAILRGRVEEMIGWALLAQDKPAEATVHFKRAVSILPDKSAWWRSSMWRLGAALQADGKEAEALDAYIRSYSIDKPDIVRYTVVEALYKKLNGSDEGLEARIGKNPLPPISPVIVASNETPPIPTPETIPAATPEPTPAPQTETPSPSTVTPAAASPTPSPTVEATPEPSPSPDASPTPATEQTAAMPASTPTPQTEEPKPENLPSPTPSLELPGPAPTPTPEASPETVPSPTPEASPTPAPDAVPSPTPETVSTTPVEATPTPSPLPGPVSTPSDKPVYNPNSAPATDDKTLAKVTESPNPERRQVSPSSTPKPLFEPIIINIPRSEAQKSTTGSTTLDGRPRLIDGQPVLVTEPPPCQITASQERVSLLNNGGSISVLVGVDKFGKLEEIKYLVSDPEDLAAAVEKDIEGIQGRSLYVIRSISERTGDYRVTFYLPCGKKDIYVTVR